MTRAKRLVAMALVLALALSACGTGKGVGKGIPLDKIGGKGGTRLGEKTPGPRNSPLAKTTTPAGSTAPTKNPGPTPAQQVIQIFLIRDNPYYQVEGLPPGQKMEVPAGVIVRWVNKEPELHRKPFSPDLFECEDLKPGGTCDYFANVRTSVDIQDRVKVFATGTLVIS